jgi:cytochrome c-type biogenesis protein
MTSLPLPLAVFVAGLISFLSPCVLPLVPGYVSLISGVGVEQLKMKEGELFRKVMLNSAAFIVGFSIVFITLGAISTEVGQVLVQYKSLLSRIAGVIIILFGIHLTGLFQIKWLLADTRLHNLKGSNSAWGAFVIGFAFAFGWTPCVGPILAVVLGFAAVPFLLTSLGIERFLKFYNRFKFHMHAVEVASGVLLIALGILLVMGRFTLISGYFSFLNRFAL